MITKQEMLNYYKANLPITLKNFKTEAYDCDFTKNNYKKIYDKYKSLVSEKNDVVLIKEIDVRVIFANFHTPLNDLMKNMVKHINGDYCLFYQLKNNMVLEILNEKNGKELMGINLENAFLTYLNKRMHNQEINFDQFLRTEILYSKLEEKTVDQTKRRKI